MVKNSKENKGKEYESEDGNSQSNERGSQPTGYQPTRGYQPESGIDRKNPPGKKKDSSTAATEKSQVGDYAKK